MRDWLRRNKNRVFVIGLCAVAGVVIYSRIGTDQQGAEKPPLVPSVENKEDLTPQAIHDSKQVAESFVKSMSEMDVNKPDAYLEQIKPLTTAGLYKQLSEQPRRPLAGEKQKKVIKMESYPVDSLNPDHKKWNVIVTVETLKENGKYQEEISYWVLLSKKEKGWSVEGVDVDVSPE